MSFNSSENCVQYETPEYTTAQWTGVNLVVGDQDGIEIEHFMPHEEKPRAGIYGLEQQRFQE